MDDQDSWYEQLAKNGWLGTKAQVSAKYGNPSWKTQKQPQDAMSQALLNAKANAKKSDDEGAG